MGRVALERALSKLGLASRTQGRALILDGQVEVDGRIERDPEKWVVPERIVVRISGQQMVRELRRVIAFHKPRGLVTTRSDERGRPTIYSVMSEKESRLIAVGRLDLATSGLLLLTNDTRLSAWLTDPENAVPRVYLVSVRGELTDDVLARLRDGVEDGGEILHASSIQIRKRSGRETHLIVELKEGKNREIRRLFLSAGHEVTQLKRVSFGGIALGELESGKWRELTDLELTHAFPGAPLAALKSR